MKRKPGISFAKFMESKGWRQKPRKADLRAKYLEGPRSSVDEFKKLDKLLQGFTHEEYVARNGISADMFNSGHEWLITLTLKPKSTVCFSRPVRVGRWTHRWWRVIEEFPNAEITGRVLYAERLEDGLTNKYRLALTNVDGGYNRRGLKVFVDMSDIVSVSNLKFGNKQSQTLNATFWHVSFVRRIKHYPSEAKALTS